jgi:hypothetical protein
MLCKVSAFCPAESLRNDGRMITTLEDALRYESSVAQGVIDRGSEEEEEVKFV